MAYATYTTDALVCGNKDSYTSDRSYLLFTRTLGMLWARARSVREERSKQRYALQDFSIVRVSLVKGKIAWRIGSVEAISNPFMECQKRSSRTGVVETVRLLRRFVQGEEPCASIYEDAVFALSCIAVADEDDLLNLQNQFALRTLHTLGYIALHDSYRELIESLDPWSLPQEISPQATRAIEQALSASHL